MNDPANGQLIIDSEAGPADIAQDARAAAHAIRLARRKTALLQVTRAILALIVALIVGGIVILLLGRDPLTFYANIIRAGALHGWQDSVIRMAVMVPMGMGLVVALRGGIWNIGGDGQFLLAAFMVAGIGPPLMEALPTGWALIILSLVAIVVGGSWTILPAYLRASFGLNEIITTVMMSFIGIYVANMLVKGPFKNPMTNKPKTADMPFDKLLPKIPGTIIPISIFVALAAVIGVYYFFARTSTGMKLRVMGANFGAAGHFGLNRRKLVMGCFFASGSLIGLAAAMDILGIWGTMWAGYNPGYGFPMFAFVFLARLNPLGVVPLAGFYAVLTVGGDTAARKADLPNDFILLLVGLILIVMTGSELIGMGQAGRRNLAEKLRHALKLRRQP